MTRHELASILTRTAISIVVVWTTVVGCATLAGLAEHEPPPPRSSVCAVISDGVAYCVACDCSTGECSFTSCEEATPMCVDALCRGEE